MGTKVILVGPGAAGKTTLAHRMKLRGARVSVSYTTRPKREGEVEGTHYHFVSSDDFARIAGNQAFLEVAMFNGWMYGTPRSSWDYYYVFIMSPAGVAQLPPELREQAFVILLHPTTPTLRRRLEARGGEDDSVQRRLEADRKDFESFTDFDLEIDTWQYDYTRRSR